MNVGNTHVRLVTYDGGAKAADRRVPTAGEPPARPEGRIAMVSVVPAAADALEAVWGPVFRLTRENAGLPVAAAGLGNDRLANAIALWRTRGPGIAIDGGTATTLTLVDGTGTVRGGAILPGLTTARDSLWKATAQLPAVPLEVPAAAIGPDTLGALQSGLVFGHVGALKELVSRMRAEVPEATALVTTGGWGALLAGFLDAESAPDLTIEGARWALSTEGN